MMLEASCASAKAGVKTVPDRTSTMTASTRKGFLEERKEVFMELKSLLCHKFSSAEHRQNYSTIVLFENAMKRSGGSQTGEFCGSRS
jgi:hypothetical protein